MLNGVIQTSFEEIVELAREESEVLETVKGEVRFMTIKEAISRDGEPLLARPLTVDESLFLLFIVSQERKLKKQPQPISLIELQLIKEVWTAWLFMSVVRSNIELEVFGGVSIVMNDDGVLSLFVFKQQDPKPRTEIHVIEIM